MTKKIIQDIIVKKVAPRIVPKITKIEKSKEPTPKIDFELKEGIIAKKRSSRKGFLKFFFWVLFIFMVFLFTVAVFNIFSSTTIKVTPKQKKTDINQEIKAVTGTSGELNFETVKMEYEDSQEGKATGISTTGQKASGKISVYNTYSSQAQKLVANTRFESPEGKIYKIQETVTVLGNGSIEVTAYAEKTGAEYNIGLSDFTIPGLKGTPKYEKIYGRSKTEMKGGASGTVSIITKEDIESVRNNLREKIKKYLAEMISKQTPDEYVFFENAVNFDFTEDSSAPKIGDTIEEFILKEKGSIVGFLMKKESLTDFLAEKYIKENKEDGVYLKNLESLSFTPISLGSEQIDFRLQGMAHFVWKVEGESLAKDLAEKRDEDYPSIFSSYPGIEKADIIFHPPFWRVMPKKSQKIHAEFLIE